MYVYSVSIIAVMKDDFVFFKWKIFLTLLFLFKLMNLVIRCLGFH